MDEPAPPRTGSKKEPDSEVDGSATTRASPRRPIAGEASLPAELPSSPIPREPLGPTSMTPGDETTIDERGENPFAGLLAEARAPAPRKATAPKPDPAPATEPREAIAERRVGPYRILNELGSGGMAVVYKALQPTLDRLVAIKELRSEYVHDRQIATRFEREAMSLATLEHGNIVHVYDYIRDEESAYIVMEYVDGIDLFDVLAETERVPAEIAGLIAIGVAAGLEYAHFVGIVHRDIKPSNILISKKGEVKIMDFGIARDPGKSELTQIGLAVGTPAYMAPEQIRGDKIDYRTDIFAFGIVLYEMLAGKKPWTEEEGRSVTVKVLDEDHPPLDEVVPGAPPELVRVVERCLEKNPANRYPTTYELRRDLEIYIQRMVPVDPRGRIVLFLRNRGFITDGEASSIVHPSLLADAALRRRDEGIPLPPAENLLRPIGIAHAAAFGGILLALLLAVLAPFGAELPDLRPELVPRAMAEGGGKAKGSPLDLGLAPAVDDAPAREPGGPRLGQLRKGSRALRGDEGYVKVVVDPWARVFVDGEFYDYTPFDAPIALPPGEHTIGLRNPYFMPVDRVIVIEPKKTRRLEQRLAPREALDD